MASNETQSGLTGYAEALKKQGLYPLKPRLPWKEQGQREKDYVPVTPFLVVPNYPGDKGTVRPLSPSAARHSSAIEIVDRNTNVVVTTPLAGNTYDIRCRVRNHGALGCFAGIAEFYVAQPAVLDALENAGPRPAPLGYAGAMVAAGGETVVACQRPWTVTDPTDAILVRVYDPIVDRPSFPYDAAADRHVARRDPVPDFSGTYVGMESANELHNEPTQIKIVIQQTYNVATVSIYMQLSGELPAVPQESGTAVITGNSFVFNFTEQINGEPFTSNVWNFSLSNPNLLHFTHTRHYHQPGDARPDLYTYGDLPRV